MNDGFADALRRFSFLKPSDLVALFGCSSLRSFQRGEIIAKEGAYCEYAFLIRKEIIRTCVLTPDGGEKTVKLAKEKEFTSCAASLLNDAPATEFL